MSTPPRTSLTVADTIAALRHPGRPVGAGDGDTYVPSPISDKHRLAAADHLERLAVENERMRGALAEIHGTMHRMSWKHWSASAAEWVQYTAAKGLGHDEWDGPVHGKPTVAALSSKEPT